MRLRHITFTGIDAKTDIQDLIDIQREFPIAEFGVLTSYHWYENGNRYINPQFLCNLWGHRLNLALHVCGRAASDAADGYLDRLDKHLIYCLGLFKRVQLNIANRTDIPYRLASTPDNHTEVIIQQRGIHGIEFYERSKWMNTSILLDASGGQGINSPIEILKCDGKVGYAGGINPDNVADKLTYLFENVNDGEFWIDIESGVRTDDWFDLGKVRKVLEICEPIIKDYSKED
ncbi:MAG: hypothetical protein IJ698_00425 [Prevotella sp.]|nr:hypothetical protein [Prevotella sp.]